MADEKTTLLIDGDILVYQRTAANEVETDWGDDLWTLHSDANKAWQEIVSELEWLREQLGADHIVIAKSDDHNFRKDILPSYKANRKGTRKPVAYKAMWEMLELHEDYEVFHRPGLEGDDVLGILATAKAQFPGRKIIVSIDKDMRTIPGFLLNLNTARKGMAEDPSTDLGDYINLVTEEEADDWHLEQTLTGDPTDGYKVCPSFGPVKVSKLRESCGGELTWTGVVQAYEKAALTEEDALVQARCARILQVEDYDFKKRQPILWLPRQ